VKAVGYVRLDALRLETTVLAPLAQATVKGLFTMTPPHANPAQPAALGATIWSKTSKLPDVAVSGMAIRYETPPGLVYSE
jgi:hypothetical protein